MANIPRVITVFGLILLLVGGASVVWGSYNQTVEDCESGSSISISHLESGSETAPPAEPISFDDLSPIEQRIFLEAYTSSYNHSEIYQKWPSSSFYDIRTVTYRNQRYEVIATTSDCPPPFGTYAQYGGIAISIIGIGLLAIIQVRQTEYAHSHRILQILGILSLSASGVLTWYAFQRPICTMPLPTDAASCGPNLAYIFPAIPATLAGLILIGYTYWKNSASRLQR